MTGNVRQTPPEPTWGTLWVTCDNSPTADGTGPQKAPEGTEDMRSIDNLRDYVLTAPSICSTTRAILVGYIDNIEREVKELRDRDYRNGVEDGEMAAERDGWVRLPVDADGVPIHVGDAMEWDNGTFTVHELKVTEDGWTTWDEQHGYTVHVDLCHHHAPTVEDVLREYADRVCNSGHQWGLDAADTIAEYAARLRLAGDE